MPAQLYVQPEGKAPFKVDCTSYLTIGRDRVSEICLNDQVASRHHAVVRHIKNGAYILMDTGSRNGTFLNNNRINEASKLNHGDLITIGAADITFIHHEQDFSHTKTLERIDFSETVHSIKTDIANFIVLVSDIRGYTSISEKVPVKILSDTMGHWFNEVQNAVNKHSGKVDKFIGDCVLARWEVPENNPVAQRRLIEQVLNCSLALYEISSEIKFEPPYEKENFKIGVGLNIGEAALTYDTANTIMGDAVNTAFRLEAATKELNTDIIISEALQKLISPQIKSTLAQHTVSLKGKSQDSTIYCGTFQALKALI